MGSDLEEEAEGVGKAPQVASLEKSVIKIRDISWEQQFVRAAGKNIKGKRTHVFSSLSTEKTVLYLLTWDVKAGKRWEGPPGCPIQS